MQVNLSGHHLVLTPALRGYVDRKFARVLKHCDRPIDAQCTLKVDKLKHQAESTVRLAGASIHATAVDADMYAAIDALADKLEERVRRFKGRVRDPKGGRGRRRADAGTSGEG
jgi:putative sigma-54 modulation protein